jgi:hypothetical protein
MPPVRRMSSLTKSASLATVSLALNLKTGARPVALSPNRLPFLPRVGVATGLSISRTVTVGTSP